MLSTQLKKKKEFLTVSHVKFFSVYGNQGFSIDSMSTKEIERHFYIFFCLYVSLLLFDIQNCNSRFKSLKGDRGGTFLFDDHVIYRLV